MSLTRTESVVLNPSEIRFRAFASLEYSETGEPLMTPGDFLDSLIQDRPRPRIKARVSQGGAVLEEKCLYWVLWVPWVVWGLGPRLPRQTTIFSRKSGLGLSSL